MSNIATAPARALMGLALIAGMAAPAFAGSQINVMAAPSRSHTMQTQVKIADLNLASAQGRATLTRRIGFAAQDVCGHSAIYNIEGASDYLRCRRDAIDGAQAQVRQRIATNSDSAIRLSGG